MPISYKILSASALLCCSLVSLPVMAQSISGANSALIQNQIGRAARPKIEPRDAVTPPQATLGSVPGGKEVSFLLKGIDIVGGSTYPAEVFSPLYESLLSTNVSIADVYKIAQAINQVYFDDGYIFSRVILPQQEIGNGLVKIQIVESHIESVEFLTDVPTYPILARMIDGLASDKSLNIKEFEAKVLAINDLPGVDMKFYIEPSEKGSPSGSLNVKLSFAKKDASVDLSFDNYGSKLIGPYQVGESVTLYNSFDHMAETTLQGFQATQKNELQYYSVDHSIPIHESGTTLDLFGSYSRILPGGTFGDIDLKTYSRTASLGLTHPVIRSRDKNLSVSAALEHYSADSKILGARLYEDQTTTLELGASLDFSDNWYGVNLVDVTLRKGMNILGARETGSTDLSRAEGRSDFTTLRAELVRIQRLSPKWGLWTHVKGQYASAPLLSSEQFGYGGNEIGRAYNPSEIVGDHGISALAEVFYKLRDEDNFSLSPYGFYDIGKTWNIDNLDGEGFSGASAGVGIRADWNDQLSLDLTMAYPLTRSVAIPDWANDEGPQVKFSLGYGF